MIDIEDKYCVITKCYKSKCPHFDGVYLLGGESATKCATSLFPLQEGKSKIWYCERDYTKCPYYIEFEGATKW